MSNDWTQLESDTCFTRRRSEIMAPRDNVLTRDVSENKTSTREMTFDELFRERFVPLDSRKKVGNYVLGKVIGEGSFAKVRLGKHVDTGEKVGLLYSYR